MELKKIEIVLFSSEKFHFEIELFIQFVEMMFSNMYKSDIGFLILIASLYYLLSLRKIILKVNPNHVLKFFNC